MAMIGMEIVTEFVKTAILTGKLANKDMNPVSVLLISPPEHGKTSIVLEQSCSAVIPLSDVTGTGLKKILEIDKITHIAVLDLAIVTSHKNQVSNYLYANMNAIAEEGYVGEATPNGVKQMKEPVKRALICCMTPAMCKDGRQMWNKLGFTSRMLPFNYKFSDKHREAIRKTIVYKSQKKVPDRVVIDLRGFQIPNDPVHVNVSKIQRRQIDRLAKDKSEELGQDIDPNGFRRVKQFIAMVAAHAILRNQKYPKVTQKDIDFLAKISKYISYKKGSEL